MKISDKKIVILFFLILTLVSLRLGIILTGVESVSHTDELGVGTMSRELVLGRFPSVLFYQIDPYSGGSLIWQVLVIPFFFLFGQNLFSLKMVPLFFSILTLCSFFYLSFRHFGLKSAVCTGLLYVFAAPSFFQLSSVLMAGHSEDFFYQMLNLFLFFEYLYKGEKKIFLILSALTAGLSVWIYYAGSIMAATCLLTLILEKRKSFLNRFLIFSASFFAGFFPWIILNSQNHFLGLRLLSGNFHLAGPSFLVRRLAGLFFEYLPAAFSTAPVYFFSAKSFSLVYFIFLLAAIISLYVKKSDASSRSFIFLIYMGVYCAVYAFSDFQIAPSMGFVGLRYLTPLMGILILSAGSALGLFFARKWLLIPLLCLGLAGQGSLLFREPFAQAFKYKAVSYFQLGTIWYSSLSHYFRNYDEFDSFMNTLPEDERKLIFFGLAYEANMNSRKEIFEPYRGMAEDLILDIAVKRNPESYKSFFYEWLGVLSRLNQTENLNISLPIPPDIYGDAGKYFCRGWLFSPGVPTAHFGCDQCFRDKTSCHVNAVSMEEFFLSGNYSEEWRESLRAIEPLPISERSQTFGYLGYFYFTPMFDRPDSRKKLTERLSAISARDMNDVYRGMGWKIRERFIEDRLRALDWIDRLPEEGKSSAKLGLIDFDAWY